MVHDAKVCLKHYSQTTEEHFERATGGAKSGAQVAQNPAQQITASYGRESLDGALNPDESASCAISCATQLLATTRLSGEGGIRTLGDVAATPVFETGPIGRSGTSPDAACSG